MQVRPARPEDAAAVAAVHVRSWQGAYEHVFGADRLASIDVVRRQSLAQRMIERHGVAVAEDEDGGIVGFVSVGPSRDMGAEREGELYAIYVLPEAWGSGAGRGLMDAAKELLSAYEESVLWVLEDNPRARRFYEREGWALDGESKRDEFLGVQVIEVRYRLRSR